MKRPLSRFYAGMGVALVLLFSMPSIAQPPGGGGPGGGGRGGPGGMMGGVTRKILATYDTNKDGYLNLEERKIAREALKKGGNGGGGMRGGFGPPGMGRGNQDPPKPGPKMSPADVKSYPDAKLYDGSILRTIFLEFEAKDWEQEMEEFHGTDVSIPVTMIVDGKKYEKVGVHFRGMSSYMMVGAGFKRSLSIDMAMVDSKQKLYGYKSLNLNNGHDDATYLNTVLYSHIASQYIAVPKANLVRVVINGEYWGVYTNVQQFNKDFTKENFKTDKGARWKVRGSPMSTSGLEYIGDRVEDYKRKYEIKTKDNEQDWKDLINFCKVLNQTPADKLEEALKPLINIDELLWFLALDNTLVNCDGYWIRSSDYTIFKDEKGKFHIIPHDMNESFRPPMGPGMGGGGGGGRGGMGGGGRPGGPGGGGQGPGGGGFPGGPPDGPFPGGMMIRGPQPGEILPSFIADMLQLTAEQKKSLEVLQKETDEKLAKILTNEQKKQLKDMKDNGPMAMGGGPGGPGGSGMGGNRGQVDLDPLVGMDDARKPLRSKVLAVPKFKAQYLKNCKTIANDWLDWKKLGPIVAQYRTLIDKDVEMETRKLSTYEAFKTTTSDNPQGNRGRDFPLKTFADLRRKYLVDYVEGKKPTQ